MALENNDLKQLIAWYLGENPLKIAVTRFLTDCMRMLRIRKTGD